MDSVVKDAYELALKCRTKAYAPYSRYKVGAAVKAKGSEILFFGCNVENSSYGATICAERNAVFSMISQLGKVSIEFLVLVTDNESGALPCAMCLQVLSEFCHADTPIYIGNMEKLLRQYSFKDLLPQPFSSASLPG